MEKILKTKICVNCRNPFLIFENSCQKCNREIQTAYKPGRPEKVFCEKCYLETVY